MIIISPAYLKVLSDFLSEYVYAPYTEYINGRMTVSCMKRCVDLLMQEEVFTDRLDIQGQIYHDYGALIPVEMIREVTG